jgi:hypothetical protein
VGIFTDRSSAEQMCDRINEAQRWMDLLIAAEKVIGLVPVKNDNEELSAAYSALLVAVNQIRK